MALWHDGYIIPEASGCGKTAIIRALELQEGYWCLRQPDLIAYEQTVGNQELWAEILFIDGIIKLKR